MVTNARNRGIRSDLPPRERVLSAAAHLFAAQGFAASSMRDLARAARMSLSGLYHYFSGKDELLFEIQSETYAHLIEPVEHWPAGMPPEKRIGELILNHLTFFSEHMTEMKVLSHEGEVLRDIPGHKTRQMRRRYYDICLEVVTDLLASSGRADFDAHLATMSLFGMINWIYTWYRPRTDTPARELARQMTGLFLKGVLNDPMPANNEDNK